MSDRDSNGVFSVSSPENAFLKEKSSEELHQFQLEDQSVGFILKAKENDQKPHTSQIKGMSIAVRRLTQLWDRLRVHNGSLCMATL